MRILKVSRCFYPAVEYGGPIGKMLAIGKGLIQRGHSVTVYASNLLNPREKTSNETLTREVDNIRAVYLNSVFNYHWDPFTPGIFGLCRKELKKFDIIHIYGYRDLLSTVVSHYARKWEIPYVFEPLGMFSPVARSRTKKRLYDSLLGKKMVEGARKVIASSESEKEKLLVCGIDEEKIFLRRNGIDLSEFANLPTRGAFREQIGVSETDLLVLYLGRMAKIKNLDLLISAFSELDVLQVRLAIVGSDDGDGSFRRLLKLRDALSSWDRIILHNSLYGQKKLQALVDADVFVLPSGSESFGNAAAEALACGTPVIVTNRCGIAPWVEGKAGLVIDCKKEEIGDAIYQILTDKELRERFVKSTHEVKRKLSWQEPIEELEGLYKDITGIQRYENY